MTISKTNADKASAIDAALKAAFDAKAGEGAPEHLIELAHRLDRPQAPARKIKTG